METFETVWQPSRTNVWSWGFPTVVLAGIVALVLLSRISEPATRRLGKSFVIFGAAFLAAEFSHREIAEKWRLRHEWTQAHGDTLTESQRNLAISDGANLVMGPLIFGIQALALLCGVALLLTMCRRSQQQRGSTPG